MHKLINHNKIKKTFRKIRTILISCQQNMRRAIILLFTKPEKPKLGPQPKSGLEPLKCREYRMKFYIKINLKTYIIYLDIMQHLL